MKDCKIPKEEDRPVEFQPIVTVIKFLDAKNIS